ncbi:unnamed protein product, partial [Onchocerca ochengi]|uniref:Uncharacterized protein n=1 Tax=Onchocerca ochengi TaxID=42157 RepID=A0A182F019_ONCOC
MTRKSNQEAKEILLLCKEITVGYVLENFVVTIFLGLNVDKQVHSEKNLFVRNSNSHNKCNSNGKGNNNSK